MKNQQITGGTLTDRLMLKNPKSQKNEPSRLDNLKYLTAIVPLDLEFRAKDILTKVKLMLELCDGSLLRIIFAHNDRKTEADAQLRKYLSGYCNISLLSGHYYEGTVNSGLLRNIGFKAVQTDYLVLLDIDLWLDLSILSKYLAKIIKEEEIFTIIPCLYLSEAGSTSLISRKKSSKLLRDEYFSFSRKDFLHLANPSSIVILKSNDYQLLKGFDTTFKGHGYEDFDFLLRLAVMRSKISPSVDFFDNTTMRAPLFAQGFRRELGRFCLLPLLEKDFFFHIFHQKPNQSDLYYSLRQKNYIYFCEKHKAFVDGERPLDPTLMTEFIHLCTKAGKRVQEYSIYFENKPGHVDRYDTFRKRLKFLFK